jgi:hypothetical protein
MRTAVDEERKLHRVLYGGYARVYDRRRRRTALDGNVTHRSYQNYAKIPFIWSVAAFPPRLNIAS